MILNDGDMTITHHQCPKCGYEQIDLLNTTSELKYYCQRCEFRFSADRRSLPPAGCALEDSVPVSGCTPMTSELCWQYAEIMENLRQGHMKAKRGELHESHLVRKGIEIRDPHTGQNRLLTDEEIDDIVRHA